MAENHRPCMTGVPTLGISRYGSRLGWMALCMALCLPGTLGASILGGGKGGRRTAVVRDPVRFVHVTQVEGLSQSLVHDFAQDSRGFLWIATSHGLNRFDGVEMEVYFADKDDPTTLSSSNIQDLDFGRSGYLWLATVDGLSRYDPTQDGFLRYAHDVGDPASLSGNFLSSVVESRTGGVWVGTRATGLNLLDPETGQVRRYRHSPTDSTTLDSDGVRVVFEDSQGRIWVGTDSGLNLLTDNGDVFRHYPGVRDGLRRRENLGITAIHEDSRGRLWIGRTSGVEIFDPNSGIYSPFLGDASEALPLGITSILQDDEGVIWIGTATQGMVSYDGRTGETAWSRHDPDAPSSISSNTIRGLFLDQNGALWVGCEGAGISMHHPANYRFSPTHLPRQLASDHVRAFSEGADGTVWVGTQGGGLAGLNRAEGDWTVFSHDPNDPTSLAHNNVFALCQCMTGDLWAGTAGGWLNKIDPATGSVERFQTQPQLVVLGAAAPVRAILVVEGTGLMVGEERDLWVGTDGAGLIRFREEGGVLATYMHDSSDPSSISNNRVRALVEGSDGSIWIGTYGGGVNRLDPATGKFTRYRYETGNPSSLGDDQVMSLMMDPIGNLWVGTNGGGLNQMRRGTGSFIRYGVKTGLPNDAIYGVLADPAGSVWFSHDRGISRLDPQSGNVVNFDVTDGLQSNEFNGGAVYQSESGEMFFGGLAGFNAFLPKNIEPTGSNPTVAFRDLQISNQVVPLGPDSLGRVLLSKSLAYTDSLFLSNRDQVFSLGFAALNFIHPERTQYAYRLLGFEEDWNGAGDRRWATYTNLPPGHYTFQVRASNSDGVWGNVGASVELAVAPPFWSHWWFRALILLSVLGAFLGLHLFKTQSIANQNRRLEEKVAMRTAELLEQADELSLEKNRAEETLAELQAAKDQLLDVAHKAGMAQTAVDVLHNVGNILNSLSTSAALIHSRLDSLKVDGFKKANELLASILIPGPAQPATEEDPDRWDGKAKKLLAYYERLREQMDRERVEILENSNRLASKIAAITDVIADQQRIAKSRGETELLDLEPIVEDALEFESGSMNRHSIDVRKRYDSVPHVMLDRAKVLHAVLNLVKNAKESMIESGNPLRILDVEISQRDGAAVVAIRDTGKGMDKETLERVFGHGFTTREDGHGFGLHSCANYMSEMGGSIQAESEGLGLGATFTLSIPLQETDVLTGDTSALMDPVEGEFLRTAGKPKATTEWAVS